MDFDFTPCFKTYESVVSLANAAFDRICSSNIGEVTCKKTCDDCCHALFDLTLIEALYINHKFKELIPDAERKLIIEKANRADRKAYQLKRAAYKKLQAGGSENQVIEDFSKNRCRCPFLKDDRLCLLYEFRPITCRVYGVPLSIGGRGHTCGLTNFNVGKSYPTINMDIIFDKLRSISKEMVSNMGSHFQNLENILMPLSMALLTTFDASFFGLDSPPNPKKTNQKE